MYKIPYNFYKKKINSIYNFYKKGVNNTYNFYKNELNNISVKLYFL